MSQNMWIASCICFLALGASAAPAVKSCGPQNIVLKQVTDTWSLPVTKMDPMSTCTYSFTIPNGTYAEIILSGTGLGQTDSIDTAGIEAVFDGHNDNYQVTTLYPSKFDVIFNAGLNSTMSVQFIVDLYKVKSDVANSMRVFSNDVSKLIYPDEWEVGTSYQVMADTFLRLEVAFNNINSATDYQMNNIFIYDGDNAPVGLNGVQSSYYLAQNKKVSLYLARKITDIEGALFLTDNSNLAGIMNHHVQFVPTDPNNPTNYATINADYRNNPDSPWGAVTIVGKSQGSPMDVRGLSILSGSSGTFQYAHGGPMPNHSNAKPLGQKNLPFHVDGTMNTFYLTQGTGNIKYTVN